METKVFYIYTLLGILFGIVYLIYLYNKYKEITLRDILLYPFFIIIWPIFAFCMLMDNTENIKVLNAYIIDTVHARVTKYNIYSLNCLFAFRKDNLFNMVYHLPMQKGHPIFHGKMQYGFFHL